MAPLHYKIIHKGNQLFSMHRDQDVVITMVNT